jgi:hypothetical protein
MAESFGNSFTIVEVTTDDPSTDGATPQFWLALAKPAQALTLVLAAVPEGWTAELAEQDLTDEQWQTFQRLDLRPGDVYRLTDTPSLKKTKPPG